MKVLEALATRRAVREFRGDPVDRKVLTELIDAAVQAPSYMNLQPWSFAVIDDAAVIASFGEQAKQHLRETMGFKSPFSASRAQVGDPSYHIFYGAPALILINSTIEGVLAEFSCATAAYGLMLAAHSMGLGTCLVSQALPWLRSWEGRNALHLAKDHYPVAPIIVGCPLAETLSPRRLPPSIHWIGDDRP